MNNNLIREAIADYLGERCKDFDSNCMTCQAWAKFDSLIESEDRIKAMKESLQECVTEYDNPDNGRTLRWAIDNARSILTKKGFDSD